MRLRYFAIWVAFLPFFTVHACYLLSAWQGFVEWCIPYLHGCSSISAAGRHGVAYFVFKGVMIPAAVLMVAYWWLNCRWLKLMGSRSYSIHRGILCLGITASLALILYCCVLGSVGEHYYTLRRIGVTMYFGLTFLTQLLMTQQVHRLMIVQLQSAYYCKLALGLSMLVVGIAHLALQAVGTPAEHLEDVFEWNFALLMILYYLSSFLLWRYKNVTIDLRLI
jgi:Frag1/DRAM/Sfk1 family